MTNVSRVINTQENYSRYDRAPVKNVKRKTAMGKRCKLLSVSIFSSIDNISRPPVLGLL